METSESLLIKLIQQNEHFWTFKESIKLSKIILKPIKPVIMKTQIKILSFFIMLGMVALLFFSCAKEEILTGLTSNRDSPRATTDVADEQLPQLTTLAEALTNIKFSEHPELGVEIKSFPCRGGRGTSLVAYNPYVQGLDFYDLSYYMVFWFKDGKPLNSTNKYYIDCVCNGEYVAIVYNKASKQGIGLAYHTVRRSCIRDEVSINNAVK